VLELRKEKEGTRPSLYTPPSALSSTSPRSIFEHRYRQVPPRPLVCPTMQTLQTSFNRSISSPLFTRFIQNPDGPQQRVTR
jgi:hypothetical protein